MFEADTKAVELAGEQRAVKAAGVQRLAEIEDRIAGEAEGAGGVGDGTGVAAGIERRETRERERPRFARAGGGFEKAQVATFVTILSSAAIMTADEGNAVLAGWQNQ